MFIVFVFKQKTAYEMRISDWSSDVCSSDLLAHGHFCDAGDVLAEEGDAVPMRVVHPLVIDLAAIVVGDVQTRHLVHDGGLSDEADDVKLRDINVRYFALSLLTTIRRCGPLTRENRNRKATLAETVGASGTGFWLCLR